MAAWKDAWVAKTRLDGIDGGDLGRLPAEAAPGLLAAVEKAIAGG